MNAYDEYDIISDCILIGDLSGKTEKQFVEFIKSQNVGTSWFFIMSLEYANEYEVVCRHYKIKNKNSKIVFHSPERRYKIFSELKINNNGKFSINDNGSDITDCRILGILPDHSSGYNINMVFYRAESEPSDILVGCQNYSDLRSLKNSKLDIFNVSEGDKICCFNPQSDKSLNLYTAVRNEIRNIVNRNNITCKYSSKLKDKVITEWINNNQYLRESFNIPIKKSVDIKNTKLVQLYKVDSNIKGRIS